MLQSRAAIQAEIDKVLARSARLTEAAKARAATNIKSALSGSGFGDVAKRNLSKTIAPVNTGFRKGSIAEQFVDPGEGVDEPGEVSGIAALAFDDRLLGYPVGIDLNPLPVLLAAFKSTGGQSGDGLIAADLLRNPFPGVLVCPGEQFLPVGLQDP